MNETSWLQNLKVNDQVILKGYGINSESGIGHVVRFTKNFIIVKYGQFEYKFRKEFGMGTEKGYCYRHYLKEATPEKVKEILLKKAQVNIQSFLSNKIIWKSVPEDVISHLYEVLDPFVKEDKKEVL